MPRVQTKCIPFLKFKSNEDDENIENVPSSHRGQSSRVHLTPPSWPASSTSNEKLMEIYCKLETLTRTRAKKNPPSPALPQVPLPLLLLAISNLTVGPPPVPYTELRSDFPVKPQIKTIRNLESRAMLQDSRLFWCFRISYMLPGQKGTNRMPKRRTNSPRVQRSCEMTGNFSTASKKVGDHSISSTCHAQKLFIQVCWTVQSRCNMLLHHHQL